MAKTIAIIFLTVVYLWSAYGATSLERAPVTDEDLIKQGYSCKSKEYGLMKNGEVNDNPSKEECLSISCRDGEITRNSMLLRWHVMSSCLVIIWLCPGNTLCPSECSCRTDEREKRKVSCLQGGMTDPIPTFNMDSGMEILEISAPDSNWNMLSLGAIFQNFKRLEEIFVTKSNLLQIGMHAFWGVPTLKVLNLTFNNLSVLFDHNFRGLVNLVQLNLDDNRIERLPSGAFRHLSELRTLTMQGNHLGELVPRLFLKLSKLQVLKISGNPLQELNPEVFKDVPELRVLECRACGLARINTQIYHLLPYLTHLDLGNNRLQFVDADEFRDLHRLRSLRLDGNQLPVVLERTFVNQVHLRILCLARNRLAKITNAAFLNLSSLVELDISYNKLSKLEDAVLNPVTDSLQKLTISGNQFPVSLIKVIVQVGQRVRELSLADMGIVELPSGLLPNQLLHLNVSGNNLTNLSVQVLPQQLVALDISRNKFRGLEERLLLRLEKLQELRLDDNLWSCDACHVVPMLSWMNRSATIQNLRCASPKKLAGRLFNTLILGEIPRCPPASDASDFLEDVERKLGLVIGGACLVVFLIASVLFVVCSCIKRHRDNLLVIEKEKRRLAREATSDGHPIVIFGGKGEISFKFPLDLTERKVSVSTIDDMKKEARLPNGTGI